MLAHQRIGVVTVILFSLLTVWRVMRGSRLTRHDGLLYTLMPFAGIVVVSVTGCLGGHLMSARWPNIHQSGDTTFEPLPDSLFSSSPSVVCGSCHAITVFRKPSNAGTSPIKSQFGSQRRTAAIATSSLSVTDLNACSMRVTSTRDGAHLPFVAIAISWINVFCRIFRAMRRSLTRGPIMFNAPFGARSRGSRSGIMDGCDPLETIPAILSGSSGRTNILTEELLFFRKNFYEV